jgi:hypothetical protein
MESLGVVIAYSPSWIIDNKNYDDQIPRDGAKLLMHNFSIGDMAHLPSLGWTLE